MRYRSRAQVERGACDEDRHPGRVHDLTVYDPGDVWRPTGLLDAKGEVIERYGGLEPIGFLHDAKRRERP